ncbi:MAG TPA: hypothetical protein VGM06_01965 [Polyangiaceae bacterium]|jgi:hypothetical protein
MTTRRREVPVRYCNGGVGLDARRCGRVATVVCAEREARARPLGTLEWFACDLPAHQETGIPTPIETWFERRGLL